MRKLPVLLALGILAGCEKSAPPPAVTPAAPEPVPPLPPSPVRAQPPPPPPPPSAPLPPPVPPPLPLPPPAALDERGLLEAWRARIREGKTGAERDLALAESLLLEGQPLKAHELLRVLDPSALPSEDARTAWRLALALACSRLGDADRAHDLLKEAGAALRPLASLRISDACFSASPASRIPVEKPLFRPGQMVTLCLDVDRLLCAPAPGGGARTKVRFDLTLIEPSGRTVSDFAEWEKDRGSLEEAGHRPWEDHAYRLTFPLPRGANLGEYVLKAEVTDLSGPAPRRALSTLPLTLR